jgi:hypothetical protein
MIANARVIVITGLDPAIHQKKTRTLEMDARIKSGHDDFARTTVRE